MLSTRNFQELSYLVTKEAEWLNWTASDRPTTQHQNTHTLSNPMMLHTDRFAIIFPCDHPDSLSEPNQKTDPSCLPNFKLLVCALAGVA
jgi:hypothetical protein